MEPPKKVIKLDCDNKENASNANNVSWGSDDDDDDYFNSMDVQLKRLELEKWNYCKIERVRREGHNTILDLSSAGYLPESVYIEFPWTSCHFEAGDTISIICENKGNGKFSVNINKGLLIVEPYHLISTTTLSSALFCERKTILSEYFNSLGLVNSSMIVGSLIHGLFQNSIQNACETKKLPDFQELVENLLNDNYLVKLCYESNVTKDIIKEQLAIFVKKINDFLIDHVIPQPLNAPKRSQTAIANNDYHKIERIEEIVDIEEYLCCTKLGLKGKVDVTVKIHGRNKNELFPLEIKTGKAMVNVEHKAQLCLYIIMMKELGVDVESGLLLYLRENKYLQIPHHLHEIRDIIILRNELVYYLSKKPTVTIKGNSIAFSLPPPINRVKACEVCEVNTSCFAYLSENSSNLSEPLAQLVRDTLANISSEDLSYFFKWMEIIFEESKHQSKGNTSEQWSIDVDQRLKLGTTVSKLKLKNVDKSLNRLNTFDHTFSVPLNFLHYLKTFSTRDFVSISTTERVAIAFGQILEVSIDEIKVRLEYDLRRQYLNREFIIDRQDYSSKSMKFYYTNMSAFLQDDSYAQKLRTIISAKPKPCYDSKIESSINIDAISKSLNEDQKNAVLKSMSCTNYTLIEGFPGTGKTQTITAIIQMIVLHGKSVIIASHTNSAVDNVLLKLLPKKVNFLRIGRSERVANELLDHCESELIKNCSNIDDLEALYTSYNVFGVTCHSIDHPLFKKRRFDFCIIDEATQIMQPAVFRVIMCADKFILVGDTEQLPPIIVSEKAKELGGDNSLFSHLNDKVTNVSLTIQYRMNEELMNLANIFTYKGLLKVGTLDIKNQVFENEMELDKESWLSKVYSNKMKDSVVLINTGNLFDRAKKLMDKLTDSSKDVNNLRIYVNPVEVMLCLEIVNGFLSRKVNPLDIGIVTPYKEQSNFIRKMLQENLNHVKIEVNTIDQYQGRDKRIIIYSCSKSKLQNIQTTTNTKTKSEILDDHRRLNVAITRAKEKFVIVGDCKSLRENAPFVKLFDIIGEDRTVQLENYNIDWDILEKYLNF